MGGGGTLPSDYNQPTPEPAWVSPSGPQLVHSLWRCAPVAHPHTNVHTTPQSPSHTHTHAHAHTHTHTPGVFPESTQDADGVPSSQLPSAPRGLLGPQVPKTQPQAWHMLAFPGF